MKHLLAAILLLWIMTPISNVESQNTSKGINDPKAHQHLESLSQKIRQAPCLQIQFDYTLENKSEKIHEKKKGSLTMKKSMYKLEFMGLNVRSDGKTVWSYNKDVNEVQVNEPEEDGLNIMNPLSILQNYKSHFRAKYIRSETQGGQKVHVIDLLPFEANMFHKIRIICTQEKPRLLQCILYDTSGSTYSYTIKSWDENGQCANGDFFFNKNQYPSVSVIDMR